MDKLTPSCWVFSVTPENFSIARESKVWAVKTKGLAGKISKNDRIILYVTGAKAFCSVLELIGDWKPSTKILWSDEKEENRIKYAFQAEAEIVQEGVAEIEDLKERLSFITNKDKWGVYLRGAPANMGRAIPESDYKAIVEAMKEHPLLGDVQSLLKAKPRKRPRREPVEEEEAPRHNDVRDMVYEIGKFEGKIPEKEYPIDNLRLDVVWKTIATGNPRWAFEVQMAGNFYEALTKLKHAWDKWNSRPYLITTEEYMEQARWLLDGSFHEMKDDTRIINWEKIVKLHKLLKDAHEIRLELRL